MTHRQPDSTKLLINIFYGLCIFVQILVLAKIVPYNWVNGGMSTSYRAQAVQSVVSIAVMGLLYVFCQKLLHHRWCRKWQVYFVYAVILFWTIGLIMQLLGTHFERYCMSPILLLGVISHILLLKRLRSRQ